MATDIFHKIAAEAEAEAEKTMLEIEVLVHIIADKMEHLHGVPFQVLVSYERRYVTVVLRRPFANLQKVARCLTVAGLPL